MNAQLNIADSHFRQQGYFPIILGVPTIINIEPVLTFVKTAAEELDYAS